MTFLVFDPEANNILLWVNIGTFICLKYNWSIGQKEHLIMSYYNESKCTCKLWMMALLSLNLPKIYHWSIGQNNI
jgi:hypothetical protein